MTAPSTTQDSTESSYDLGVIKMRLLADAAATGGALAIAEFSGTAGAWTIPHLHRNGEESFFVLDGSFTFTVGEEQVPAQTGSFILVPRGTRHMMAAGPGGGRFLTLWTPGGPEAMFIELSRLGSDGLRDPDVRRLLSARFDSIPV